MGKTVYRIWHVGGEQFIEVVVEEETDEYIKGHRTNSNANHEPLEPVTVVKANVALWEDWSDKFDYEDNA